MRTFLDEHAEMRELRINQSTKLVACSNTEGGAMLVLTRRTGESIRIGNDFQILVLEIRANQICIGVEAPPEVMVLREELHIGGMSRVVGRTRQTEQRE